MDRFLKYCQDEKARAERGLAQIAKGVTFQEGAGTAPMRDVTHELAEEWTARITELDAIMRDWKKSDAQGT